MKFYPLFFQAGKILALRANFWFILCSFRQGRLALRANFWFILCFCSGREDLALRANICYPLFWQGRIGYPLFMQGRLA